MRPHTYTQRIEKLKSRMQFSVVLASFFPVLLQAIFFGSDATANRIILLWGFVVAVLITSYMLIEISRGVIHAKILSYTNAMVLLNTASYIPVMIIAALVQGSEVSFVLEALFQLSMLGVLVIPVAITTLLVCNVILKAFRIQIDAPTE
ncbi:MAG: hypothetical protein LR017_00275 [Candidatus Pacebacteria bacterium]|nr:hypothetical protein [Candidatus Paceibacterota bacterium]